MPQLSLSFRLDLWSFMILVFLISLLRPTSMALRQEVLFQCKLRSNRTSRILQLSNERDIYSSPSQSRDNCRLAELDVPLALFLPRWGAAKVCICLSFCFVARCRLTCSMLNVSTCYSGRAHEAPCYWHIGHCNILKLQQSFTSQNFITAMYRYPAVLNVVFSY